MRKTLAAMVAGLALLAPSATGAGPQSRNVHVLGPFTVSAAQVAANWNATGHVGEVQITTLAKGTLILDFWAETAVAFPDVLGSSPHYTLAVVSASGETDLLGAGHDDLELDAADTSNGVSLGGGTAVYARRASTLSPRAPEMLPGRMLANLPVEVCVWTEATPPLDGVMNVYIETAS